MTKPPRALDPTAPTLPLDPACEVFLRFERFASVHSNQIVLLGGDLSPERLRVAAERAAAEFPLLLAAPAPSRRALVPNAFAPSDIAVRELRFEGEGELDFANRAFRRFLLDASERHPPRWSEGPPLRFLLVRSGGRSCALMSTSHAVADALSDAMLLDAVARHCREPEADPRPPAPLVPSDLLDGRAGPLDRLRGMGRSMIEGAVWDVSLPVRRRRLPGTPRSARPLDFHHEVLPDELRDRVLRAARAAGSGANAVFCAALARLHWRRSGARRPVRFTVALGMRPAAPSGGEPPSFGNWALPCPMRMGVGGGVGGGGRDAASLVAEAARKTRELREGGGVAREQRKIASLLPFLRLGLFMPKDTFMRRRMFGANVFYSNPGVLPEPPSDFGPDLPALAYAGLSAVLPPYSVTCYTPQLAGRLHWNAIHRADHFDDFAAEFAEPFKEELARLADELLAVKMLAEE